ncbi:hypothetical protein [Streptomyces sp. NBC_01089]|uniref:hypothetical protein n=1 Tax=Streptomyces sp. NBC_01089 TaxID=2903747 RepID=UPI00386E29FC|nr:hypothetical protein OG510_02015 [Streptomyces sp. NBC_01089]
MNHPLDPPAVPACTGSPRAARVRGVLTVAAGLAISAVWGQGVSAAATQGPLLVSSVALPTRIVALEVDNSQADSWLEVDRTANAQTGAGDAGSDHEGGD